MTLSEAITAVEGALTVYNNAVAQTANDQAVVADRQQKLDAAKATVNADVQTQTTAATAQNKALDDLIAAATAAKIPAGTTGTGE